MTTKYHLELWSTSLGRSKKEITETFNKPDKFKKKKYVHNFNPTVTLNIFNCRVVVTQNMRYPYHVEGQIHQDKPNSISTSYTKNLNIKISLSTKPR